ncbi:MAG: hypothetical protein R3B84_05545 [Zavarzinella sp.]
MFPEIHQIHQNLPHTTITDLEAAVSEAWKKSRSFARIQPGMRIAVGVGSRGISNIARITRATIITLQEMGAKPFLVAAMGSHGGATPEGQRTLLADYGITEESMQVPILTDMDVDVIGTNSWDAPVYWDRNALQADGVVTIARIKPHTDYRGKYESGLMKMAVIGFGKRAGAAQIHLYGATALRDMIPESMNVILEKTKYFGGLGIIENAHEETHHLEVVDRDDLLTREPELLKIAHQQIGKLPFEQLDLLVIGEIGKNYSGSGIDPNVVGRFLVETAPDLDLAPPHITRICALDLSPESHGNGVGCGIADLISKRLADAIDPNITRTNVLTACFLWRAKVPFSFPTDQDGIRVGLETCWQPIWEKIRMAIIPNSLEVADYYVSQALLEEVGKHPNQVITGQKMHLPFDESGNLIQEELFPHSVRSRRSH